MGLLQNRPIIQKAGKQNLIKVSDSSAYVCLQLSELFILLTLCSRKFVKEENSIFEQTFYIVTIIKLLLHYIYSRK
jgi:hypothetical protein